MIYKSILLLGSGRYSMRTYIHDRPYCGSLRPTQEEPATAKTCSKNRLHMKHLLHQRGTHFWILRAALPIRSVSSGDHLSSLRAALVVGNCVEDHRAALGNVLLTADVHNGEKELCVVTGTSNHAISRLSIPLEDRSFLFLS